MNNTITACIIFLLGFGIVVANPITEFYLNELCRIRKNFQRTTIRYLTHSHHREGFPTRYSN